jgi:hypothetical protein
MTKPTRSILRSLFLALIASAGLVACGDNSPANGDGGGDDDDDDVIAIDAAIDSPPSSAPLLRNPVNLADADLANQALMVLGGPVEGAVRKCDACHGINQTKLRTWETLSNTALDDCLTDLDVSSQDSALAMIACLRYDPEDAESAYVASHLGVYASAAHLPWFEYTFEQAYGATAEEEFDAFTDRIAMPRAGYAPFTQEQFDIVAEWFARGLPLLEELVPIDPGPGGCTETIGAEIPAHVAAMATQGWDEVNEANGILMYGCAGAETPRDCLATLPLAGDSPFSEGWNVLDGSVLHVLRTINYQSSYWTRSSADGRFVAHGRQGGSSTILDLQTGAEIQTTAFYDPGFFPDNSAFAFQGSGTKLCDQSLLTSQPASINYSEPQCTGNVGVGLYQHMGAALDGGDYWTVAGQFVSDNGGHFTTFGDPIADFDSTSDITLTAMIHDGNNFSFNDNVQLDVPNEGDVIISPSAKLLLSRVSGAGVSQSGFQVHAVNATKGTNGYTVTIPTVARYCVNGGKPAFSYDERWIVYHHYISNTDADAIDLGFTGTEDPGFDDYQDKGTANVYLLDLLTGDRTRITNMQPGQYALFPHFRSDGWIYIQVRDGNTEYVVASDAAMVVGAPE